MSGRHQPKKMVLSPSTSSCCRKATNMILFVSTAIFAMAAVKRVSAFAPSQQHKPTAVSSPLFMATWSDNRATQEYQDFLASGKQEIEKTPDGAAVIVRPVEGPCELADALFSMGMRDDVVLTPGQELPNTVGGADAFPIYITIPPTQLKQFLTSLPDSFKGRRDDFVFFAGGLTYGNIEGILKDYGYCRDTMTQVLISGMKFSPRIDDISISLGLDAQGEEKLAGECAACGKWQGSIEQRLTRQNVRCRLGFYREWRRLMWERTAYDCVFHVVGAVRSEPTTVQQVALYYDEEASDMLWGISGFLRGSRAVTLTYGFEERLFGVAEANGADQKCTLVDEMYPFLYQPFEMVPNFFDYICYAQDKCGLLPSVSLLRRNAATMEKPPIIRTGNLRADGVL